MNADLTWLLADDKRCPDCFLHVESQGHRSHIDGERTGCDNSGPLGAILGRQLAVQGMARTVAAHPDDAARVDAVLERFIRGGRPFSANDTRRHLVGVKGAVVGAGFRKAAQSGRIVRTGRRYASTDPGTHAHQIDEWVAA
jgi:hypothetical protein